MKILPRRYILRGRSAVRRTLQARPVRTGHLVANYKEAKTSKAGFFVPKRLGNSVVRNLCKRRMREIYRHLRDDFPEGNIIFRARKITGWDEMRRDFYAAVRKIARQGA